MHVYDEAAYQRFIDKEADQLARVYGWERDEAQRAAENTGAMYRHHFRLQTPLPKPKGGAP